MSLALVSLFVGISVLGAADESVGCSFTKQGETMKKLFPVGVISALTLMAAGPIAADSTNGQDRVNGARACSTLKTSLGATTFGQTYGTNASRSNAFGKCVSRWTSASHAARTCDEMAAGPDSSPDGCSGLSPLDAGHRGSRCSPDPAPKRVAPPRQASRSRT